MRVRNYSLKAQNLLTALWGTRQLHGVLFWLGSQAVIDPLVYVHLGGIAKAGLLLQAVFFLGVALVGLVASYLIVLLLDRQLGRPLLSRDPELALAYHARGLLYQDLDVFQRAIDDYTEAIRLDSQLAQAYLHRSRAYHQIEQFEHALEDLDEVLELTPDSAEAFHHRGLVLEKMGQSEDASRDFAQEETLRKGVR